MANGNTHLACRALFFFLLISDTEPLFSSAELESMGGTTRAFVMTSGRWRSDMPQTDKASSIPTWKTSSSSYLEGFPELRIRAIEAERERRRRDVELRIVHDTYRSSHGTLFEIIQNSYRY